jgi:hypothetical protein
MAKNNGNVVLGAKACQPIPAKDAFHPDNDIIEEGKGKKQMTDNGQIVRPSGGCLCGAVRYELRGPLLRRISLSSIGGTAEVRLATAF